VLDLAEEYPGRILHRAVFLRELLVPIPREKMHANKKLVSIAEQDKQLLLRFEDGSTAVVDALIGADGIFGFVRSYVLEDDHEAVKPVAAGWAAVRNLVPFDKARDTLGAELFEEDRQYGWIGEGGLMMHDVLSDRQIVQCIGTTVDPFPTAEHRKPIDRKYLQTAFASWLPGPVTNGMIDVSFYLTTSATTDMMYLASS
jgi:salicylate hydroxylase